MADWVGAGTLPSAWRLILTLRRLLPACAPCGWTLAAASIWKSPSRCSTFRWSPRHTYHFHALMRTEEITTESGMRFSLVDPNHNDAVNALTDNFTGSHNWTALDMDVTTSHETHFLLVRLLRTGSRLFENKLSGTVWIADVSLVPEEFQGNPSP